MKRFISLAVIALMLVALFAGCGNSSPVGKYVIKTIDGQSPEDAYKAVLEEYGEGASIDELLEVAGISSLDEMVTFEFKEDGTMTSTLAMEEETLEGTWTQDGDKLTITMDGESEEFKINGKELSCNMDGQEYVFIKK